VRSIEGLFPKGERTTLLRGQATVDGVTRFLRERDESLRAVHLACHGHLDTEMPLLTGLVLSHREVLSLDHVYRLRVPADLVVLSACETGKGKLLRGEGVMGLVRAFFFAGAPRVICSLWKVDDEATRALMVEFYELWNPPSEADRPALPAAMALKQAQEFVGSHEKWKHPYYWAAWVLWGLPD
jgi:CHAT domain-containing protein